jgi:ATP-dependent protease ClpP protease subunit
MTSTMKDGRGYALSRADANASAADAPAPPPTLYLYDVLGVDLFGGIPARAVVDDLAALGPVEALDVRVNSPGGDVFEAIAVYNALVRFPAKVTVHVDGVAASAASLVAMAGDKTLVAENAMVMIHRPWTQAIGDAPEMRRQADVLDKAWSAMLATYARRTGRRAATFDQRVADAGGEWWLSAGDAVAEGMADAVEKPTKEAQVFGLARFQRVPARLAALCKDAAAPAAPMHPRVVEIEAPRVVRAPLPDARVPDARALARDARRRIVDVLRLTS